MTYALISGLLWGLDTVVLGMALAMVPYIGTEQALALGAIVGAFFHDAFCAIWMSLYMAIRGRLKDTWQAVRTRSGKIVMIGALLGGPIGMTGFVVAINNIGASQTAIISAFYPAFGAFLSFVLLKERMRWYQLVAFAVAVGGIVAMSLLSATDDTALNPTVGVVAALVAVAGWGSEAVFCAWGMRDDNVDNETALHIREIVSALVYGIVVIPFFGAWAFVADINLVTPANGIIALAALAGVASYIAYYKGIATIGASKAMAVNISYSAWAVFFGLLLLGDVPSIAHIVCCIIILAGTILSAADIKDLFSRPSARTSH